MATCASEDLLPQSRRATGAGQILIAGEREVREFTEAVVELGFRPLALQTDTDVTFCARFWKNRTANWGARRARWLVIL